MAIALVAQDINSSSTPSGTSAPINCTSSVAGNLMVLTIHVQSSTTVVNSVSDNLGSTWVKAIDLSTSGSYTGIWYLPNCPSGVTTVTAVESVSTSYCGNVSQWSGVATSSPVRATNFRSSGVAPNRTNTVATLAGDLDIGAISANSATARTLQAPFSALTTGTVPAGFTGLEAYYLTPGGTDEASWATASAATTGGVIAVFIPAADTGVGYVPQQAMQPRDPGAAWWLQRDRRDATTLATAANPLPSPLDSAWQAGGRYWHLYGDFRDRRAYAYQRAYVSDPGLLVAPPTDPLSLPAGPGARAAAYWDRRQTVPQRVYVSDPSLLATAQLETELLASTDDRRRHASVFTDRRVVPWQPRWPDPALLAAPVTDPLTLAAGVGGDLWRRYNVAAYADRRETAAQPTRSTVYFDAGPGTPPLALSWGAGGNLWHLYQWRRPERSWWPPRLLFALLGDPCVILRPTTGTTARGASGATLRPDTGDTTDPC